MKHHKANSKDKFKRGMEEFVRELGQKFHNWNKAEIARKEKDFEVYKPLYRLYSFAICRLVKEINYIASQNKCYTLSPYNLSGNPECKKLYEDYKKTQELYSKYNCGILKIFKPTVPGIPILGSWYGSYEKAKEVFNKAVDDILEIYPDFNVDNFLKNLKEEFDNKSITKGGFKRKTKMKSKRKSKMKPKRKSKRKTKRKTKRKNKL